MSAPIGAIFDEEALRTHGHPRSAKHSSLDWRQELRRLELREKCRPEFQIFTGNDLAIDMIEYGSDYLLGLATLVSRMPEMPEKGLEPPRGVNPGRF